MLLSGTLYAAPMFHGEEAPCADREKYGTGGDRGERRWGRRGGK